MTAQRREERLIEVPASVAVTDGTTLQRYNLSEASNLVLTTPGLALGDANTPRGAGFRIHGIGTSVFADGIEQSVGTVVDGVPYARAGQGLADLVDVERIEVLRSPQGLLFGRNASAGLINITTPLTVSSRT
ncbi:MAG: Plug domain-containing protein [Erythrobacter sp.]|uniref:Plug domain-containing protein n=1 Tax=Erythrobacter sp. TaxID=1042 RepID=UPI00263A238F|nr:Plug domain-containing protein [Erythrobacter sp.]MDJ0979091.1 Plug domain-containing protein [Erythrobacter sp.]